jgi:hypothetical protein
VRWMFMIGMLMIWNPCAGETRIETIYRCVGDAGETYFTDRVCAEGRVLSLDPAAVVTLPVLDADSRIRAQALDRELAARMHARATQRSAMVSAQTRDEAARVRRCAAAEDGIDRVRAMKRRGYRVSSGAALDARETEYRKKRDRDCRPER